jgi:SH3-like domain-containing protein
MHHLLFAFIVASCLFSNIANALEFKTIGASPVVLFDAPSLKGGKLYIAPRGMPVEVILTYGTWSKVRDVSGDLSWVESKELVARRNVIVRASNAKVRVMPDDTSALVFSADKSVLLELAESVAGGWVKVKHRDGQMGYIKVSDVWGV